MNSMSRLVKKMFLTSLLLLVSAVGFSQKVTFESSAPAVVEAGEVFRVEFSLNANPDDFTPPNISGFDVLAGPTTSKGQSISIVNGNVTQNTSFTYTYVLQASSPGRHSVSAAQVVVEGKSYSSQPLAIEVVGEASEQSDAASSGRQQSAGKNTKIASDDVLVRVLVNRNTVFKGQPIKVTFKLYSRVPLSRIEGIKLPAFNGFWTQELNVDNYPVQRETLNSKVYDTRVIKEYLIFPQQAGVLQVEQFDMTVVAQIVTQARRQSLIDDFFSGGASVQEVPKKLSSAPVKITVKELPSGAPTSFNGAVGNFTMTSQIPSSTIAANSSANYLVKISGSGNLPLVQSPKLTLPTSFEQYNIKTTESLSNNGGTISGSRQFEYPFIARAEGTYDIEPIEFTYFNADLSKYITLSTKSLQLTVLPDSTGGRATGGGMVSGLTKEDIKILGQDIRFIKIGAARFTHIDSVFMWSLQYFIILALIIIVFVLALIYLQKRIKEMKNSVLVRGKRANKVALQRLKAAEGYMKSDDSRHFYEEMLRALWGYMSDKLNIPVANLTKENMREELHKRDITVEQSSRFIELISMCEYAQYSPDAMGQMPDIYGSAVQNISKFESLIKK